MTSSQAISGPIAQESALPSSLSACCRSACRGRGQARRASAARRQGVRDPRLPGVEEEVHRDLRLLVVLDQGQTRSGPLSSQDWTAPITSNSSRPAGEALICAPPSRAIVARASTSGTSRVLAPASTAFRCCYDLVSMMVRTQIALDSEDTPRQAPCRQLDISLAEYVPHTMRHDLGEKTGPRPTSARSSGSAPPRLGLRQAQGPLYRRSRRVPSRRQTSRDGPAGTASSSIPRLLRGRRDDDGPRTSHALLPPASRCSPPTTCWWRARSATAPPRCRGGK